MITESVLFGCVLQMGINWNKMGNSGMSQPSILLINNNYDDGWLD